MKKVFYLFTVICLVFVYACNSAEKPGEEAEAKAEISMENLVEVSIPVHGMTCEGCENALKKSVGSLEGIADVSASHVDSVAIVKYDSELANLDEIKGKISDAGYTVAH